MNTIRREQKCAQSPDVTLTYEGDKGEFFICMTRSSVLGGTQCVFARYTKEELAQFKKSLDLFFQ